MSTSYFSVHRIRLRYRRTVYFCITFTSARAVVIWAVLDYSSTLSGFQRTASVLRSSISQLCVCVCVCVCVYSDYMSEIYVTMTFRQQDASNINDRPWAWSVASFVHLPNLQPFNITCISVIPHPRATLQLQSFMKISVDGLLVRPVQHSSSRYSAPVRSWLRHCPTSRKVRFPLVLLGFFIDLILPAALWSWVRLSLWQKWVQKVISWRVKAAGAYGWKPYHLHVPIV